MKKVLLALLVLVMLGYSAFSLYIVMGMQKSQTVEETVSETEQISTEETELAAAYAEVYFKDLALEYCETDGTTVTEEALDQIAAFARNEEAIEALIQELGLKGYTAEQVCECILVEAHAEKECTVKLMVIDEDQYTAANLCSGVLEILKNTDLSELCSELEIQEVGTEEYPAE